MTLLIHQHSLLALGLRKGLAEVQCVRLDTDMTTPALPHFFSLSFYIGAEWFHFVFGVCVSVDRCVELFHALLLEDAHGTVRCRLLVNELQV